MYSLTTFLPFDYRTDLSKVDWEKSIVMFGCSMVYGEALDEQDTIPYHISKALNIPVVNMGVIGSSMYVALYNQLVLHSNFPKPKAVINVWTEYSRSSYFGKQIEGYGPWNIEQDNYGSKWTEQESHARAHALMVQASSKNLWKDIGYYEATFFKSTQAVLKCDQLIGHANDSDYASDGQHPGPIATKMCADYIVSRLSLS